MSSSRSPIRFLYDKLFEVSGIRFAFAKTCPLLFDIETNAPELPWAISPMRVRIADGLISLHPVKIRNRGIIQGRIHRTITR
jgi:hypothetical protein